MNIGVKSKAIMGILGILILGLIGFRIITHQTNIEPPKTEIKEIQHTASPNIAKKAFNPITEMPAMPIQNNQNSQKIRSASSKTIPTAQSSDAEIRNFFAWLSNLDMEESPNRAKNDIDEIKGKKAGDDNSAPLIEYVIQDKWKKGYENHDIGLYMSSIWEDKFFYISDIGTPENASDDVIFRGGQMERESASKVFRNFGKAIQINLRPLSDITFLGDKAAMVKYGYESRFSREPSPESSLREYYAPGSMVFILEKRKNDAGADEWRILEWYDYATPR